MISSKIKALFNFIDYLGSRKMNSLKFIFPLCLELGELDVQRAVLRPRNNYNDKLKHDIVQKQISEKFKFITEFVYKPIIQKLLKLKIWSGDEVYISIFNNNKAIA